MNPNIERVLDIWAKEHDANIKYVGHLSNEIQFMVDDYRFIIHYPLDYPHMDEGENFFVEIDDKCCIDWLKDINRYILDVKPNLRRLLIHMDKMYCRSKMDSLDVDDQMEEILEETELKKKLVGNLRNNQPVGKILIQEFLENKKEYASNKKIALSLTGDDIYMWNVKYTLPNTTVLQERFGYNYIEVEILFHNVLYPDYPPYLRVVRPKFKDALHEKIAHLKIVRAGYWSPKRKIKQVINKMANIFEKYAVVDIDEPLNSLLSYPYNDFEDALCELVSLSNDETDDPVDNAKYDRVEKSEQLIDKQDYDVAILINNLKTILKSSNKIELLPERINGSHLLDTLWSHSFDERDGNNNLEKVKQIFEILLVITGITEEFFFNKEKNIFDKINTYYPELMKRIDELDQDQAEVYRLVPELYNRLLPFHEKRLADEKEIAEYMKNYHILLDPFKFLIKSIGNFRHTDVPTVPNKRSTKEFNFLKKSLPCNWSRSIYVRVDTENNNRMRVMMTGPVDTPYENGCYFFDLMLPANFPQSPPKIHFLNSAGRRCHPNLHEDGQVCFHMLEAGKWKPGYNIHVLLMAMQCSLLNKEPYKREVNVWTKKMESLSEGYNSYVKYYTMSYQIYDVINGDKYPEFGDAIKEHFRCKRLAIIKKCKEWVDQFVNMGGCTAHHKFPLTKSMMQQTYNKIVEALQ